MKLATILVVEDNTSWRELLQAIFRSDYQVEDASNAQEAAEKIHKGHYQLVITNLQLRPISNVSDQLGLTVLEKLQENAPGTPCIILTGSDHEKQRQVQAFCDARYGARISVLGKGSEDLYTRLRDRVKAFLRTETFTFS